MRGQGSPVGRFLAWGYLAILGMFFAVPMLAMARFAFQSVPTALLNAQTLTKGWSLEGLAHALSDPQIMAATRTSLLLVLVSIIVNLALLLPVAIVVEVSHPVLRPWVSAATLLPWVVPPVALVVGVAATFRGTVPWFLASPLSLAPFYALWAMPFTYRALENGLRSMHARTLVEASLSLGCSYGRTITRMLIPSLWPSMVASACLTAALVLGEFAFASLLLKQTLPTQMLNYQRSDPRGGLALALFVMIVTAALLAVGIAALRRRGMSLQATGI
ncbi:MAG: ABC transporter permease subunit [Actinomycetales bacterium]|nr:ABC transporter permease subunit [Actinomycetales bacterium]